MTKNYLTEEEFEELSRACVERTPYYTAVVMDFDFQTCELPKVLEGKKFKVTAPCKATVHFGIPPHHDGYEKVILQEGVTIIAGKVYSEDALSFGCTPLDPDRFVVDYLPERIRASAHFGGGVSISIFRYHIGRDLEEIA